MKGGGGGKNRCQRGDGASLGPGIYIAERDADRAMRGSEEDKYGADNTEQTNWRRGSHFLRAAQSH